MQSLQNLFPEIKKGSRRTVFIFDNIVIKVPRLKNWVAFIAGIRETLEERYWWCTESGVSDTWDTVFLARILWADRFGIILVAERCDPVIDSTKFEYDLANLIVEHGVQSYNFYADRKEANFGYTKDGRLVFIDYGYFGGTMDCYLGCKNIKRK